MNGAQSQSVAYDFETGLVKIKTRGDFDLPAAADLRGTIAKWLNEHPLAVIADLTASAMADDVPAAAFPDLVRAGAGAPVLLVVGAPRAARVRQWPGTARVTVYEQVQDAVHAAVAGALSRERRFHLHLRSEQSAPARARWLAAQACEEWDLNTQSAAAQIIVSELVTNAIRHAGTDLEVTIVRGRRELHLHVRDRSPRIPRLYSFDSTEPEHSRGLKLIDGLASSWGTTLRPYGKSVWATLPIMPAIPVPSR